MEDVALRAKVRLCSPPDGVKVNCAEGAREGGLDRLPTLPPRAK